MGKNDNNEAALRAASSPEEREKFLREEQEHILRLTSKILKKPVTKSDDEWAIAFNAVSTALDSYKAERGDFWGYAAVVIRNRITDHYRKQKDEVLVRPEVFDGDTYEDDPDYATQQIVAKAAVTQTDDSLKEEILALEEELKVFDIDFFDLAETSPKSEKTRKGCIEIIKAIFMPPPLVEAIRRIGKIPAKDITERKTVQPKLMERHRKYLIATTFILSGDYPMLSEYVPFLK